MKVRPIGAGVLADRRYAKRQRPGKGISVRLP